MSFSNRDSPDSHKIVGDRRDQPGLEVGVDPGIGLKTGWENENQSVCGSSDQNPPAGSAPRHSPDVSENTAPGKKRDETKRKRIAGCPIGVFWAIVGILAVAIAVGLGAGLGAGLSQRSSCASGAHDGSENTNSPDTESSQPTATAGSPSSSSSQPPAPGVSPPPFSHCGDDFEDFNASTITPIDASGQPIPFSSRDQTFRVVCNTNWPDGSVIPGSSPRLLTHDIMRLYARDLATCVVACAEYNRGYETSQLKGRNVGDGACRAVSIEIAGGGFCYLKNATGTNDTSTSRGRRIDSAVLY